MEIARFREQEDHLNREHPKPRDYIDGTVTATQPTGSRIAAAPPLDDDQTAVIVRVEQSATSRAAR
jgi:hypothetical protein